jgi:hypothetical protein
MTELLCLCAGFGIVGCAIFLVPLLAFQQDAQEPAGKR